MGYSNITTRDLQVEAIGPTITEEGSKLCLEKKHVASYMNLLARWKSSTFQDLEIYLTTEVDLVEVDFRLDLDEYNSTFVTHEVPLGTRPSK